MAAEGGHSGMDKPPASGSDPVAGTVSPRRIEDLLLNEPPSGGAATAPDQGWRGGYGLRWTLLGLLLFAGVAASGFFIYLVAAGSFSDRLADGAAVEVRQAVPARPPAAPAEERPAEGGAGLQVVVEEAVAEEAVAEEAVAEEAVAGADVPVPRQEEEPPVTVVAGVPAALAADAAPGYRVLVGPFLQPQELDQALLQLAAQGLRAQPLRGSGPVRMIRLLAGTFPRAAAEQQLQRLQVLAPAAFLLPVDGRWALYAGSFHEQQRADALQERLAARSIVVTQVEAQLNMEGTLLAVLSPDLATAQEIARQIAAAGLLVQVDSDR
ncbi:MAG: hypothetical protein R6W66_00750 [Pelovirga sp.]